MNSSLQYLIYLCQIKNDLNRKRRRFHYYMMAQTPKWDYENNRWKKSYELKKHISFEEAKRGYNKAQTDMKAMTSEMRQLRLSNGVKFMWNSSGAISWVGLSNGEGIDSQFFKSYYDSEMFEQIFFK